MKKITNEIKILLKNRPLISGAIGGILGWLITHFISGVIEDYSVEFWKTTVIPWLLITPKFSNLIWIAISIVLSVSEFLLIKIINRKSILSEASIIRLSNLLNKANSVQLGNAIKLYDDVISLFQEKYENKSYDSFTDEFFLILFKRLNPEIVNGGGILLRSKEDKDKLKFWKMNPDQAISPKSFYIGKVTNNKEMENDRGIAGNVFINDRPEIVNIIDRTTAISDNPLFKTFNMDLLGHPRYTIPYSSFVCIPIHWGKEVIGVLSIESQELKTFNEEVIQIILPITNLLGSFLFLTGKNTC